MADRVLFPNGFTTAGLVDTYLQLAPVLLPTSKMSIELTSPLRAVALSPSGGVVFDLL
jgi:hypothetical protein